MRFVLSFLSVVTIGSVALAGGPMPADAAEPAPVSFSRDVLPILSENCLLCHGPDAKTRKADLRLDVKENVLRAKEPIIVPGKSGESELVRRMESDDAEEVMPPPKSGHVLSPKQRETLRRWVDQGARWGKHWAFEPSCGPNCPGSRIPPGSESDRRVRAFPARGGGAQPVSRGRSDHPDPAALARPDRAAADSCRGRRVRPEHDLPAPTRSWWIGSSRSRPLRRADGDGLARRGPLRRHQRLPERLCAHDVALARLGDRRVQRATSPSTSSSSTRSPATCCPARPGRRRWPPASTATTAPSPRPARSTRSGGSRTPSTGSRPRRPSSSA